jgi:MFS transporter, DHA2 family, multidrug resistance protein
VLRVRCLGYLPGSRVRRRSAVERWRLAAGTAIFSLTRNLGSSIGISVVNTLLTRNTQIMRATLGEHVSRYSPILRSQLSGGSPSLRTLAGLNATVTKHAAMIAYNNDFKLMMVFSLAAIPLVVLLRKGRGSAEPVHIE